MHKTYLIITITLISLCMLSCGYSEDSRTYSPDSTKFLLKYYEREVPWAAGSELSVAVIKATQSTKKANKFSLSTRHIDTIYWKDSDTIILVEKFHDFRREGKSTFKDSVFSLNGVIVKVIQKDPIDSSYSRKIIYQETSPNKQYELIVYRYEKHVYDNYFINISVINKNDSIPKYGNFFISKDDIDCFTDIRWDRTSTLAIKVSRSCYHSFNYYLVKNRPPINFKVQNADTSKGNIGN